MFTETGPLVALAVAIALLIGIAGPASAQFFNFGGFGGPPQRQAPQRGAAAGSAAISSRHSSSSSSPRKRRARIFPARPAPPSATPSAERNVLVLGDAMADWLGYGLEDAYSEQPDMGVIRKHKTVSGLIKYQPRGEPADWAAAARGILANEKPDAIVVMLGIHDRAGDTRGGNREEDRQERRQEGPARQDRMPRRTQSRTPSRRTRRNQSRKVRPKPPKPTPPSPATNRPMPNWTTRPKTMRRKPLHRKRARARRGGLYEFRDERWVELYAKKIEEMIGVLKSKGVPVLWVGLPAIRGPKGTSDMLFLDALYRDAAGKAGITYVDVWDGFVDEAGRFLQKGPDFEGQIRQLRTSDGVFFTRPGARKLAHYVEREVTRLLASRSGPIALPIEPATPDANAVPGQPAPRPLAGPILPLVASSVGTDQLLGGPGSRPAAVDALAARTLVKGEALAAPAGRADDFAWPRREIGREQAKGDTPVAATSPSGTVAATPGQKQLLLPQQPLQPQQKRPFRPAQTEQPSLPAQTGQPSLRDFFGGFGTAPRQPAPPAAGPPRTPIVPGVPRPPANVGRSAEVRRAISRDV